ncbi:YbjN domain-containing protein [uncultured Erythrobacter sp.]|uniref:YbjN domain-containing protein n=1 Tax=uncultured Erythrobacter sp. TaxID=263913 RepID=UPI0026171CBD|nr:YbjN domain-containing protein [uncultured Erythrobacter sp.]
MILLTLALGIAAPAAAQNEIETVSAGNPAELAIVMMNAGYDVELTEDGIGDPLIKTEVEGLALEVYFYGCDETTNDNCDSLQLSAGFDRDKPWTREEALAISQRLRFASVRLNEDGDPTVSWDIVTGEGIPREVFLQSLTHFSRTVELAAEMVFAESKDD